jgi:hypothetical protein
MSRNYWYWDYLKVVHPRSVINANGFLACSQHKIHFQKKLKSYKFRHVVDMDDIRNEFWILKSKLPEKDAKRLHITTLRGVTMLFYVWSRGQPTIVVFHHGGWRRGWQIFALKVIRNATEGQQRDLVKVVVYCFDQQRIISFLRIITALLEVSSWKAIDWKNENTMEAHR